MPQSDHCERERFTPGERVEHDTLGSGTIKADEGNVRVKVRWDRTGEVGAPRATALRRAGSDEERQCLPGDGTERWCPKHQTVECSP